MEQVEILATATETYSDYTTTIKQSIFGSRTDPILSGLLPEDVNSDDFTVVFDLPGEAQTVGVDALSVEIFYYIDNTPNVTASEGLHVPSPYSSGCVNQDTLVLVGINGLISVSTDASVSWKTVESGTSNTLRDVSYSEQDGYVAVGDNGVVLTSDDAQTWVMVSEVDGDSFTAVDSKANIISGNSSIFYRVDSSWKQGQRVKT
jgi:hypothetical protein